MTPEDIRTEIDQINRMMARLTDIGNDLWVEKDRLRNLYKSKTGEEI